MKYQVIVMAFDGDIQRERPEFESIDETWEYANDLGSKWYFYPFCFVVKGQTIQDAPDLLRDLKGKRIKTVRRLFNKAAAREECQGMNGDQFMAYLHFHI